MSSSDELVEAKGDTTAFGLSSSGWKEIRPFHALREECALDADTLFRFRDRFQFPEEVKIHLSRLGKCASIRLLSSVALGSPSIHSSLNS